jgi:hypothetical protein
VLLGAELNAEIEHASPYGRVTGEKVPLAFARYQTRCLSSATPAPWATRAAGARSP